MNKTIKRDLWGNQIVITPKCCHCGKDKMHHKARDYNCPIGRIDSGQFFFEQFYQAKTIRRKKK